MAQQIPSSNCIRASQRSKHRLTVPSISMSLRSRRAQYPTVTLELQQLDRFHDRAEKVLSDTITAYGKLKCDVDATRWKCVRSKHGLRLFRVRHLKPTGQTPLLCVGMLRGRFDDVMEGLYCQNTEEMLLTNAIKCPRLSESAVLYAVQRQTSIEPYAFTGIKWASIKLSVSSNRDLCYFDKMGMVRQTSGKRMAYHVMQSVDLPECPLKANHRRVQMSVCYLLEELEDDVVAVYMQGEIDSVALSYFATPAITDVLLSVTSAMECTRAKKLAEMVSSESRAPSRRSSSSRRCCDVCRGSTSFFEHPSGCAGCKFEHVCRKCRVKEYVLAREAASSSHLMRAEFCHVCISKVESMSMVDIRDEIRKSCVVHLRESKRSNEVELPDGDIDVNVLNLNGSLTSFSLKALTQVQLLDDRTEVRMSNLSSIGKASIFEGEDEIALLEVGPEGCDLLRSRVKQDISIYEKELASTQHRRSYSTTSTTSSSYYDSEGENEQYQTSLLARLQQVSNQAEETFLVTSQRSQLVYTMLETSCRRTQLSEKLDQSPNGCLKRE